MKKGIFNTDFDRWLTAIMAYRARTDRNFNGFTKPKPSLKRKWRIKEAINPSLQYSRKLPF